MKLPTRYIKTSKTEKVLISAPVSEAIDIITSISGFSATEQGDIIILKPENGVANILTASIYELANGEAAKAEYSSAFDVLAFLKARTLPILCLIASITLLLVCAFGSMQTGVMWAFAVVAILASFIYLVCGERSIPKKLLLKKLKKHLKQFAKGEN